MGRQGQLWRLLTLLLVVIFVLGGLVLSPGINNTSNPAITATIGVPTNPSVVFPTVPPGGTKIEADYTYFHSSGLLSLPHLVGWDPQGGGTNESAEQRVEPTGTPGTPGASQTSLAGVTFINSQALSVIHAYVEKDPTRKAQTFADLDKYYTREILDQAWVNFTGGWTELNRHPDGETLIINFELKLDTSTYLGRQLSRFDTGWLITLRLVVPNNNPQLLDQLQSAVWPNYRLYAQEINSPLSWNAISDYAAGYLIRYPPDWRAVGGTRGYPFTVTGMLGPDTITLTTRTDPGKIVKTEDDTRAWVKANWPNAAVQTVKTETRGDVSGFSVSYSNPDADGNQRSAVTTLLNGPNGTLYIADILSSARGLNLLDETNPAVSPDLARIRNSFIVIPISQLVPTPTFVGTPLATGQPPTAIPTTPTAEPPTSIPASPAASTAASTLATLPATSPATAAP